MEKTWGNYAFFAHRDCEYFPCHPGAEGEGFNCLFCYCPLYALGEGCGGDFTYTPEGVKDCTPCLIPHRPGGYEYVNSRFPQILERMGKKEEK